MTESGMIGMKGRQMYPGRRSPLLLMPSAADRDLSCLVQSNADAIRQHVLDQGAVLFRGFAVSELADFDRFIGALAAERLEYRYASTPRTEINNRIFTATEYPPAQEIPLHNENAYQREWPLLIAFCCLVPATGGGETPLADMRAVTEAIGTARLDEFESRRVQYVRHYRPHIDLPWQKVFRTEDPRSVDQFCAENDIASDWLSGGVLRTSQVSQGVAYHPATSERLFFNQAHLFHVSNLGDSAARSMVSLYGNEGLPRQAFFGDGGSISMEDLTAVRAAFGRASLMFSWRSGDVLLLDNMQFAHGRRPFNGPRTLLASLLYPYRPQQKH
jgi:alpha-ketoglutarate-dependent taurine dioxygenase